MTKFPPFHRAPLPVRAIVSLLLSVLLFTTTPLHSFTYRTAYPVPINAIETSTTDGKPSATIHFDSQQGFYYVLWRSTNLSSFSYVGLFPPREPKTQQMIDIPSPPLDDAFYRLTASRLALPGDVDGDGIDDIYELARSKEIDPGSPFPLDPLDPDDADTVTDPVNGTTHLDNYYDHITADPPLSEYDPLPDSGKANPAPPSEGFDLSKVLGVNVVNQATSDYTPTINTSGNVADIEFHPLSDRTRPGFQYPGTYYLGIGNKGERIGNSLHPEGDIAYAVDCDNGDLSLAEHRFAQTVDTRPLYVTFGEPDPTNFTFDFSHSAGVEIIANDAAQARISPDGGVANSPFLVLTDPAKDSLATAILPDFAGGAPVASFSLALDLRVGGTALPADGMSVSFVRSDDRLLQDPRGTGYAHATTGHEAEEGSRTGLSVGLDAWDNGDDDEVGFTVRLDGTIIARAAAPTINGSPTDASSLQTGPFVPGDAISNLGWAKLEISLENNHFRLAWKGTELISQPLAWVPSPGRFILGARTGGGRQLHHVDNIELSVQPTATTAPLFLDFDNPTAVEVSANETTDAGIRTSGGLPDSGYLALTDATNDARAAMILPAHTGHGNIHGFSVSFETRIGGGTGLPADGFSFNLVRPTDPLLQEPRGLGFISDPANLEAEEGAGSGLAIGFDSWSNNANDSVGFSVRLDGELIAQAEAPTLNGSVSDPTSLQTGPRNIADPTSSLGWAPATITLSDGFLEVFWKGSRVISQNIDWRPSFGRFVLAARTGGGTQHHHFDNLQLTVDSEVHGNQKPTFATDLELDPNHPDVSRARWDNLFDPFSRPRCDFFEDIAYIDTDGDRVGFYPRFRYELLRQTSVREIPGYSEVALDRAPHNLIDAAPDPDNPPNLIFDQPLFVGFYCDGLELENTFDDPWWPRDPPSQPIIRGNPDDCQRVYVAIYGENETSSRIVAFPLVDGPPSLTLTRPADGSPTSAQLLVSDTDPHSDLRIPDNPPVALNPATLQTGDLDQKLRAANLSPLAALNHTNANDFGTITIPPRGITIFDTSVLASSLTPRSNNRVGLPPEGGQAGTFRITSVGGPQVNTAGFDASISRDGTFPWVRSISTDDAYKYTANLPTHVRASIAVELTSALVSSHSLEIVQSNPQAIGGSPTGITLDRCEFTTTGSTIDDPVINNPSPFTHDPANNPLGYIRLRCAGESTNLIATRLSAATKIDLKSPKLVGSTNLLEARNGTLRLASSQVELTYSVLSASSAIHIFPDPGSTIDRPSLSFGDSSGLSAMTCPTGKQSEVRIDAFDLVLLVDHSQIVADNIRIRAHNITLDHPIISATNSARLYANGTVTSRRDTIIDNTTIAAIKLEVASGTTLTLNGPNAAAYANVHNYGRPGYGTLVINGKPQTGSGQPPSFHRRPYFDQQ